MLGSPIPRMIWLAVRCVGGTAPAGVVAPDSADRAAGPPGFPSVPEFAPLQSSPCASATTTAPASSSDGGSSAAETGSAVSPVGGSPSPPPAPCRTRLEHGIVKPKRYTDGIVQYGNFCATREENLQEALTDPKWKKAMQEEYMAL